MPNQETGKAGHGLPHSDTQTFLSLLPGRHTFQTFDDKKREGNTLARIIHQHDALELRRLNKLGAGIYLMINEGDGTARKNSAVTRVRAYFADFDGSPLPKRWPLPPTIIIESSPGRYHAYWMLTEPGPLDRQQFNAQQEAIAHAVGSQPDDAKGLARVMRVPGYQHHKGDTPFTTRIVEAHADRTYTVEQIQTAFPIPEPTKTTKTSTPKRIEYDGEPWTPDEIYARIMQDADLNTGRNNIGFDIACQIRDNGYPRSVAEEILRTFQQEVGQGDHEYTMSEALESIKQAYSEPAREPWAPKKSIKPTNTTILTDNDHHDDRSAGNGSPANDLPPPPPPPAPNIFTQHGCYYSETIKGTGKNEEIIHTQLTNWTWQPQLTLTYPDGSTGERGILTVNNSKTHELNIPAAAWNSRKELLEQIGRFDAVCFTTSNTDIAKIRQAIILEYTGLPTARGVRSYGLHPHRDGYVLTFENETISDHPHPPLFYASTPVDPGSPAHAAPPAATAEQLQEAKEGIKAIPNLITSATALAILGYAAASAYAPRITPYLGNRIPFLYVAGERESGKTSAAQLGLEISTGSDNARLHKAPGMSPYQYDLAMSNANNLLALLDEYKPGSLDDSQLRKHHDLGVKWRGSGIAAKDHAYALNAPLAVLGEGFSDDAATLSRGVQYTLEKKHRGSPDEYNAVRAKPLKAYARHLHETARTLTEETHQERLRHAEALVSLAAGRDDNGPKKINPRLRYALVFIAYGLLHLQSDVCAETFNQQVIVATLGAGIIETLDGGEEGMTNLERFLECLVTAAIEHRNAASLIVPASDPDSIIIRIAPSVDAVAHRFKNDAPISNAKLLRKYANDVEWCNASVSTHKSLGSSVVRGIKVELDKVPERCDVSALMYLNEALRARP